MRNTNVTLTGSNTITEAEVIREETYEEEMMD